MDKKLLERIEAYKKIIDESMAETFPNEWKLDFLEKLIPNHEYEFDEKAFTEAFGKPFWNYMNRGGKRWRPFLLSVVAKMYGVSDKKIKPFLAFPEIVHNGSIIIDDIEDGGTVRRGKKALHLIFGTDIAINLGNLMYFLVLMIIKRNEKELDEKTQLRLYRAYSEELINVHLGQGIDIAWHQDPDIIPSEKQYLQMCALKTGTLARLSGRVGIILAGGNEELERKMGAVLEKAGVAFQIQDDILDVKNTLSFNPGFGKQTGNDFKEGKKTLVLIKGLGSIKGKDRERLLKNLGNKNLKDEEAKWIAERLNAVGAIDASLEFAKGLVLTAWKDVEPILPENTEKNTLKRFLYFLIEREL